MRKITEKEIALYILSRQPTTCFTCKHLSICDVQDGLVNITEHTCDRCKPIWPYTELWLALHKGKLVFQ